MKPWSFSPGFGYWASSVTAFRTAPLDALRNILLVDGREMDMEMEGEVAERNWDEVLEILLDDARLPSLAYLPMPTVQ